MKSHSSCRHARLALWLIAAGLGAAASGYGSAFSIAELGARAAGMGTAFIATADDGSAIFYNPAGIAFQEGKHMQMDSLVVVGLFRYFPTEVPAGQVVPGNGYSQSVKPHFIPVASLYMTARYSPRITFGFGVFTPFGLAANSTNFNDGDPTLTKFPGRFSGTRVRLEEFWFQPTVAYRIRDNLSIAVGPAFVHTHLLLEYSILNPLVEGLAFGRKAANTIFPGVPTEQAAASIARMLPDARARLAGTANEFGFSAGLLWKSARARTNVGLMFRSAVTNHLSGKGSFAFGKGYTLEQYIGPDFLFNAFPNQSIVGSFTTPATYGIGIANSSLRNTVLAFDLRVQDYKRFSSVPVNFGINENTRANVGLPAELRLAFDFNNSYNLAFGVERKLNERFTARLGYIKDFSPVPDKSVGPLFPDANRDSFTIGGTRKQGTREFTMFYEAMKFSDRLTNVAANANFFTNGQYNNFAHLGGMSMRFDMPTLKRRKR
jgi:long-chain fatty acid transport protein